MALRWYHPSSDAWILRDGENFVCSIRWEGIGSRWMFSDRKPSDELCKESRLAGNARKRDAQRYMQLAEQRMGVTGVEPWEGDPCLRYRDFSRSVKGSLRKERWDV